MAEANRKRIGAAFKAMSHGNKDFNTCNEYKDGGLAPDDPFHKIKTENFGTPCAPSSPAKSVRAGTGTLARVLGRGGPDSLRRDLRCAGCVRSSASSLLLPTDSCPQRSAARHAASSRLTIDASASPPSRLSLDSVAHSTRCWTRFRRSRSTRRTQSPPRCRRSGRRWRTRRPRWARRSSPPAARSRHAHARSGKLSRTRWRAAGGWRRRRCQAGWRRADVWQVVCGWVLDLRISSKTPSESCAIQNYNLTSVT
eukprot:SAG22_NODE_4563_length_1232_cov_1.544572_2_plen_254_part_00